MRMDTCLEQGDEVCNTFISLLLILTPTAASRKAKEDVLNLRSKLIISIIKLCVSD